MKTSKKAKTVKIDSATIDSMFSEMYRARSEFSKQLDAIESELQLVLNKKFDASKALQKAIAKLESKPDGYQADQDGVEAWSRFNDLKDISSKEHPFLETYLSDRFMRADFKNECLMLSCGYDNYIIQADHGRDNGVYQGHSLVFRPDQYSNEDGTVNTSERNRLIESHMAKTGCYPGVFKATGGRYSNSFEPVNTQPRKKSKKGANK